MDVLENGASVRRLNTKGCCFLCLRIEDESRTDVDNLDNAAKCYSMRQLFRHLQINETSVDKISDSSAKVEDHLTKAYLCKICGEINDKVAKICQKLEILHLELNYALECIHTRVAASAKDSNLVQEYSRRMTSDLEALSQLAFVDKLRKELARKCFKIRNGPIPIIQVTKLKKGHKKPVIKQEQPPSEDESNVEMNCDPPSPPSPSLPGYADSEPSPSSTPQDIPGKYFGDTSPTPSPNPTADHLEDVKFIEYSSLSTSQESEKLSASLKPPTQNVKTDIYHTRNPSTGMYECKKCDKKSKYRRTIANHFKSVHLKLRHKCDICNIAIFRELRVLARHKKTCQEKLELEAQFEKQKKKFQFVCNECGKRFEAKHRLSQHQLVAHKNFSRYVCDLCNKKFHKLPRLKEHRDAVHFGKRFNCGFCSRSFAYKSDMRAHERKCAKNLSLKEEPKESLQAESVPQPIFTEETGRYRCSSCTKTYANPYQARVHYKSVHLKKKFKCELCKIAVFLVPHALQNHKKTCLDTLQQRLKDLELRKSFQFQCQTCDKKFRTQACLTTHTIVVHATTRRFRCDRCEKSFKTGRHLRAHMDSVHLKKTYPCKFCNKRFGHRSLYEHKKICGMKNKVIKLEVTGS